MAAAGLRLMQFMPTVPIGSGRGRTHDFCDPGFDLQRRHAPQGPGFVFPSLQDRLGNIVPVSPPALGRVARAHRVAAIIEQLAREKRVRVLPSSRGALRVLSKQQLDTIPGLPIDDRIVKAIVNLAPVG